MLLTCGIIGHKVMFLVIVGCTVCWTEQETARKFQATSRQRGAAVWGFGCWFDENKDRWLSKCSSV